MRKATEFAKRIDGLAHIHRLRIISVLKQNSGKDMYLSESAKKTHLSRGLCKIHMKKLEDSGFVTSKIRLAGRDSARALRYYSLKDFKILLSPDGIVKEVTRRG